MHELTKALRAQGRARREKAWGCLDENQLAAYVDAGLEVRERERVEKHLATCSFCLDQVGHLLRTEDVFPADVPAKLLARAIGLADVQAPRRPASILQWGLATGAVASVVLAAALWWAQPEMVIPPKVSDSPAPTIPPAAGPPVSSAPERPTAAPLPSVRATPPLSRRPDLRFPQEGSVVSLTDPEIQWQSVTGCLFYEVRLVASDGSLVWEERSEATELRLPVDVVLTPGEKYFIWVRAYLPGGKTLKSETVGFVVAQQD